MCSRIMSVTSLDAITEGAEMKLGTLDEPKYKSFLKSYWKRVIGRLGLSQLLGI